MISLGGFLDVRKEERALLYRIYFIFFISGMVSNILGVILPPLGDALGLSQSVRGALLSAHQAGNLLAIFISGVLPYLIGRKANTVLFSALIPIGLMLIALSGNPYLLLAAFAFTGIGRGTLSNIANVVVGECAGNKAAGLNILHALFSVGAFLSPFLIIAASPVGWKPVVIIIAVLMSVAILLVLCSSLSPHRMHREKGDGVPREIRFWINALILFCYLACEASLMGWLVTYFADMGCSMGFSTLMQSLLWIMSLTGRFICAGISSKLRKERLIMGLGLSMTLFFLLMVSPVPVPLKVVAVLGTGLSMSGVYPTTLSSMDKRYTSSTVATGICLGTATIGSMIMPLAIGTVSDIAGIQMGFSTIAIPLLIMLGLMAAKLRIDH